MRSIVGAAQDDSEDVDAAVPRRKPKAPASRARPKITRPKRGVQRATVFDRWIDTLKNALRWSAFWGILLAAFFFVVTVAGLFSGGHVSAALAKLNAAVDQSMIHAGLTVGSVIVDGHNHTRDTEITDRLHIKRGDLMLYVDVDEARARIEALPWVKIAQVRRIWPNSIVIKIVERQPIARLLLDGRLELIDSDGKIIRTNAERGFSSLIAVEGKGAAEAVGSLLALIATQPEFKSYVKFASRVSERRWDLQLANGVRVRLPEEGAEAALAELMKINREEKLLARDIKAIDLRFADRFVVKLPPGSPLIAPIKASGGRET